MKQKILPTHTAEDNEKALFILFLHDCFSSKITQKNSECNKIYYSSYRIFHLSV